MNVLLSGCVTDSNLRPHFMRVSQKWIVKAFARSRSQVVVPRRPSIRDVIAIERGKREREGKSKERFVEEGKRTSDYPRQGGRDEGRDGGSGGAAYRPIHGPAPPPVQSDPPPPPPPLPAPVVVVEVVLN